SWIPGLFYGRRATFMGERQLFWMKGNLARCRRSLQDMFRNGYIRMKELAQPLRVGFWLAGLLSLLVLAAEVRADSDGWRKVIRETPFWESQGVAENLKTIRNWVLRGSGYCSDSERHILFDRRMRFLGYFSNAEDSEKTQQLLNEQRERLVQRQRVHQAVPGSASLIGYPFALACDQPHV